ncbi:PhnD/SsuA/transferrin family substrate-binding protein [Thiolapillus brandeum]|uniref:PhnD/SsuA/transferrin family substrate-binding protein n=1 Tax=Thiolapillus brandeum TaxID=1076588 RepID=UPI000AD535FC|nr:PhnD/SsuA/transferrin family substrate-binding protein [Thiolapillus brandeum]
MAETFRHVLRFLLLSAVTSSTVAGAGLPEVSIGVLSHRGDEATLRNWSPTADYLSRVIPEYHFSIVPLDFREIEPAVKNGSVDFLLVNPGIYVNMEVRYRISRIVTLNNLINGRPSNIFGGVIFTRADRREIQSLEDIRGKTLMAVDKTSLGGFQMAWKELRNIGINPYRDTAMLRFGGTHDAVVRAVQRGEVDVGTVRTGILELMSEDGSASSGEFRILGQKRNPKQPFSHSTRLYPEWPFSKLQHTPSQLARRVAVALLQMSPLEPAAQWGEYAGWTTPLEYQPVHDLLRDLHLPPYDQPARFTLTDAIEKYWYWLLTALAFLVLMIIMTSWVARLNRALKKSKSMLEHQHNLILDSVADGIYGVDLQGNATFINKAVTEISGWRAKDLIGKNQHYILHHTRMDGSINPGSECPVYLTFQEGKPRYVEEDLFWKKDGSSFPVEYSSTPIRDEEGVIKGSVVVFRDISARKRAAEADRQYQMELAHVARLSTMGEMASGMAHELNQPLTAIATSADACTRLLESEGDHTDRVLDVLETISTQARRAGGIIQQLRQFVRKEEPRHTQVNINRLVEEVLMLMEPEIRKAHIRVVLDLDNEIPLVQAQQIQIDQVILNLARNSIEAMLDVPAENRILTLRTRSGGGNAVITSVEDSGPGLNEEIRDKLFDPFVTSKPQGMGLGLSISMGIIAAHNGNLYCDGSSPRGTVFRFTLPVNQNRDE